MEKGKDAKGASASDGVKNRDDVEAMMQRLGLKEDDLDDVVFQEEEKPEEDIRWMAVARVHTESEFSHYWFLKNMRSAWDLAKDVKVRVIEENLFILKFACLGDWEKVMEGGPWVFRGKSVLIAPYDGFTKPSSIDLNTILMWIQIHDLPDGFKSMVKSLASKVGEYVTMEAPSSDYVGNFYMVRVRIRYWCAVCGMLGHLYKEHGDGVHDLSAQIFRDLKANYVWRPSDRPSRGRGRGGASFSGPGRGGRGHGDASLLDVGFEEGKDDEVMEDVDLNRKRGATAVGENGGLAPGTVAAIAGALDKVPIPSPQVPPSPPLKRDPKRVMQVAKIPGVDTSDNTKNGALAGSLGEHRQAQ
ncbi:hypothetical protein QYE76_048657 [Lolium multiflorum]|uniref:DUF4283 domain-containing protein n=1 Tax=Lolium multiflorum TaxID=4521 RepID=A0AAD8SNJ0_LOLMU|nr:hypothetical protein QYE76_048657 [Lolium multiflorum]